MCRIFMILLGFIHAMLMVGSAAPIHTPSSDELSTLHGQQIAELWAELCGWKTMGTEDVVSKLRGVLGSVDGTISISCEESPQDANQVAQVVRKIQPPAVQNQVIFVEIPDPVFVYKPPPPPRVVVYVLPPEESHVFNILDMREFKTQEPLVHFLSGNEIGRTEDNMRLARGVVPGTQVEATRQFGNLEPDDFEIIPAISYWGDSQV